MAEYTLEWEADLQQQHIDTFAGLDGVTGVSAYRNILTLYYDLPPASQHIRELARAVTEQLLLGNSLVSTDLSMHDDDRVRDTFRDLLVH